MATSGYFRPMKIISVQFGTFTVATVFKISKNRNKALSVTMVTDNALFLVLEINGSVTYLNVASWV